MSKLIHKSIKRTVVSPREVLMQKFGEDIASEMPEMGWATRQEAALRLLR